MSKRKINWNDAETIRSECPNGKAPYRGYFIDKAVEFHCDPALIRGIAKNNIYKKKKESDNDND
jgi:hypothetical protein